MQESAVSFSKRQDDRLKMPRSSELDSGLWRLDAGA